MSNTTTKCSVEKDIYLEIKKKFPRLEYTSLSVEKQIQYWSNKINNELQQQHNLMDKIFKPHCDQIVFIWFAIGYCVYKIILLWKNNKHNINGYSNIKKWLPHVVTQHIDPTYLRWGSYSQLHRFAYIWQHREIAVASPHLAGQFTNNLTAMIKFIKLSMIYMLKIIIIIIITIIIGTFMKK